MRTAFIAFWLLVGLLIPAVAMAESESVSPIANSSWQVQDTNGEISESIPFGVTFRDDETLVVTTGCPEVSGTYEVLEGGGISIDVLDNANVTCDEAQAKTFLGNLEMATSFMVDDDGLLHLHLSDGSLYTFDPALIGVTWQWVEFQSSNDTLVTPAETDIHQVLFNQDGSVDLSTPCASGTGTFIDSTTEFDVDLKTVDTTACAADSPASLLIRDLEMATSYVIRDGHLYVALPMDGGIHEFAPVYPSRS